MLLDLEGCTNSKLPAQPCICLADCLHSETLYAQGLYKTAHIIVWEERECIHIAYSATEAEVSI